MSDPALTYPIVQDVLFPAPVTRINPGHCLLPSNGHIPNILAPSSFRHFLFPPHEYRERFSSLRSEPFDVSCHAPNKRAVRLLSACGWSLEEVA
jgi:hypothetical protein